MKPEAVQLEHDMLPPFKAMEPSERVQLGLDTTPPCKARDLDSLGGVVRVEACWREVDTRWNLNIR